MNVDKIQSYNGTQRTVKKQSAVRFQGKGDLASRITDSLYHKRAIKWLESLDWLKGEAGGIAITALGTGAVAPFPIAFNPFVKAKPGATPEEIEEVKKTKKYTAMRQPISAVLAILFQLSALKPIDIICDKFFNEERFSKHLSVHVDQSAINKKSYVERLVKGEMKKEGVKKPSFLSIFSKGYSKYKEEKAAFKALLKDRVSAFQESQLSNVASKFQETGKIHVGSRVLDEQTVAKLINDQIDDYIYDATKLKIEPKGLAFYTDRGETLVKNENYLREMFKDVSKKNASELDDYLRNLIDQEGNPKIKKILEEIVERPDDLRRNHITRTLERIDKIKAVCGEEGFSFKKYFNILESRNVELDKTITRLTNAKIQNVEAVTQDKIDEVIAEVVKRCHYDEADALKKSILHDTSTFRTNKDELAKKIHKDITKRYKKFVENTYKGRNQLIKVFIGVCVTLPITCNILNWIYPRFMDKFFPDLAGAKKASKAKEGK